MSQLLVPTKTAAIATVNMLAGLVKATAAIAHVTGHGLASAAVHGRIILAAVTIPNPTTAKGLSLPGTQTVASLVHTVQIWVGIACVAGIIVGGLMHVIEARRGHGSGTHTGHRLVIGGLIGAALVGISYPLVHTFINLHG